MSAIVIDLSPGTVLGKRLSRMARMHLAVAYAKLHQEIQTSVSAQEFSDMEGTDLYNAVVTVLQKQAEDMLPEEYRKLLQIH